MAISSYLRPMLKLILRDASGNKLRVWIGSLAIFIYKWVFYLEFGTVDFTNVNVRITQEIQLKSEQMATSL